MHDVHLCEIVEGVEYAMQVEQATLRIVMTSQLLKSRFGDTDSPATSPAPFARHDGAIMSRRK